MEKQPDDKVKKEDIKGLAEYVAQEEAKGFTGLYPNTLIIRMFNGRPADIRQMAAEIGQVLEENGVTFFMTEQYPTKERPFNETPLCHNIEEE